MNVVAGSCGRLGTEKGEVGSLWGFSFGLVRIQISVVFRLCSSAGLGIGFLALATVSEGCGALGGDIQVHAPSRERERDSLSVLESLRE